MKSLLWYLFESLGFTAAAIISPHVSPNISGIVNHVANRPTVGIPDRRFTISPRFEGRKFPLFSCLMNTVDFLVILGSRDFSGSMEEVAWKLDDYPQVGLVVLPSTQGGKIENRFVIWGLSQGVGYMIHLNRFQSVTFSLQWEGEGVGTIELVDWPTLQHTNRGNPTNSTQDLTQQSNLSKVNRPSSLTMFPETPGITTKNVQYGRLTLRTTLSGKTLPPFDVFLVTIAVLVDAADWAATERLRSYTSPATAQGAGVSFLEPRPPPTSPPFFEAQWLMQTMAALPRYMIKKGVFQEALTVVEVDGVRVAEGHLGETKPDVGLRNGIPNVSATS